VLIISEKRKIETGVVAIVKTLAKHKEKSGLSVAEIAKEHGMFPSDVEETLKYLQGRDSVECYIYRGKLYAVFKDNTIKETFDKLDRERESKNIMFG